jgi:hypothetical protein
MRRDTSPLDPTRRPLHEILRRHLPAFLAEREAAGAPLPRFVVRELEGYLGCGALANGCARYECSGCGLVRVTALSCKGRGFCPRCCGRRMSEGARDLVTRVFGNRSRLLFDGSMLPTRSKSSSAFCGVICVTTHAACSAARGVQKPSTIPRRLSITAISPQTGCLLPGSPAITQAGLAPAGTVQHAVSIAFDRSITASTASRRTTNG